MTVTPTGAWGRAASPAIAMETGRSYQINVHIVNTMSSGVADFSVGSMLAGVADDKGASKTTVGAGTSGIATGTLTAVSFSTLYVKPRVRGTGVGSFKVHYIEVIDVT